MKNHYFVSIRQEFNPRDGAEWRMTIGRESLTVDDRCAQKVYSRVKDWDIELEGGVITLHGTLEINR